MAQVTAPRKEKDTGLWSNGGPHVSFFRVETTGLVEQKIQFDLGEWS
jgi:hypothetical protein